MVASVVFRVEMIVLKVILVFGGIVLFIDGVASLIYFRNQQILYQLARLERSVFALFVIAVGLWLGN